MTISNLTTRNDYTGTGAVNTYSYTFKIFVETDLVVTVVNNTTGVESTLTITTDYTVTGAGETAGGTIVLVDAGQAWISGGNLSSDYSITIQRVLPLTQATDIRNQGDFFPEAHEDQFDRGVMIVQQLNADNGRALRLPKTETASDAKTTLPTVDERSSNFLAFDAVGNPIAAAGTTPGTVTVSAFMETVLDDADAAAARTTLGAVGLTGAETIAGAKTFSSPIAMSSQKITGLAAATANGDAVRFEQLAPGKILQIQSANMGAIVTNSTTTYADINLSVSITPASVNSTILILAFVPCYASSPGTALFNLLRDATTLIDPWMGGYTNHAGANNGNTASMAHHDSPATTSAIVYKVQIKSSSGGAVVGTADGTNARRGRIIAIEIGG